MLHCDHVIDGSATHHAGHSSYTVNMLCAGLTGHHQPRLVQVQLSRPLEPQLQLQRLKVRWIPRRAYIIVQSYSWDFNLVMFLNHWRDFIWNNLTSRERPSLHIMLVYDSKRKNVSGVPNEVDIKQWRVANDLILMVHHVPDIKNLRDGYQAILRQIQQDSVTMNDDDVILLTTPKFKFDVDFMKKCAMFTKPHKQIYAPLPYKTKYSYDDSNKQRRDSTVCVHFSDFFSYIHDRNTQLSDIQQFYEDVTFTRTLKTVRVLDKNLATFN